MADEFQDNLNKEIPTNDEIIEEINSDNEKDFLRGLKKKNKGFLIEGLSSFEKERIAKFIVQKYEGAKGKHQEICSKIDQNDEISRLERSPLPGDSADLPNYRSPLSKVTMEVIHANYMNVFFTPKDVMRVLPTEANDVGKVNKLSTFGNWSMSNELELFTKVDRLFHSSTKNGEAPYMMHWVKEYTTDIKREIVPNPANPEEPLYDPDTKNPIFQEKEVTELSYNGPKLEVFSRKDYIQPANATMDKTPEWEGRFIRISFNEFLKDELQGKIYKGTAGDIDWGGDEDGECIFEDYDGDVIPIGKNNKELLEWYGTIRITTIKTDQEDKTEELQELEEEFIALVDLDSETLVSLRKNKFPLKMRPIGLDYFLPDDEGRRAGRGIIDEMESLQKSYDALFNQFIFGVTQSNNPIIFFEPLGNQRKEPTKIKNGYMYPTSNAQSINTFQFPPPNPSIQMALELISQWSQLLFGISAFSAGVESTIDPDAPAKKAQLIVAEGQVRLNAIIKRKNRTLTDIFKRWYLLYKANMPPNKFMRVSGSDGDDLWRFDNVSIDDFNLKSLPDFELTGNILNANKTMEAQRAIGVYQILLQNPFFSPQSPQGLQSLHSLTKWLMDKLDETGLSRFLPDAPGEEVKTPEEENARFLQGDTGVPTPNEDHVAHINTHRTMLQDPNVPEEVRMNIAEHINKHVELLQQQVATQQIIQSQQPLQPQGVADGQQGQTGPIDGAVPQSGVEGSQA